ncbi:unnamed protein product, partial [Ectocarpus sp. 8 AP-2014]
PRLACFLPACAAAPFSRLFGCLIVARFPHLGPPPSCFPPEPDFGLEVGLVAVFLRSAFSRSRFFAARRAPHDGAVDDGDTSLFPGDFAAPHPRPPSSATAFVFLGFERNRRIAGRER